MARVGIVGGLGPESTIDYYKRLIAEWQRETPGSAPLIVIDSVDVDRGLQLVGGDLPGLAEYLLASVKRLAGAGVDFALFSANTPHIVFNDVAARSPVPLLSIVEVCAEEAARRGCRRVGLLGTRFTMEAAFFPEVLRRHGIELVVPDEADRAWVHECYVGELIRGVFRDEARRRMTDIVAAMRERHGIDAIVLAGTELPLLIPDPTIAGVPALDTTGLHVAAIVKRLRAESAAGA